MATRRGLRLPLLAHGAEGKRPSPATAESAGSVATCDAPAGKQESRFPEEGRKAETGKPETGGLGAYALRRHSRQRGKEEQGSVAGFPPKFPALFTNTAVVVDLQSTLKATSRERSFIKKQQPASGSRSPSNQIPTLFSHTDTDILSRKRVRNE
ncbi:Hypothetical predicted protein [Podarcis lilfordi]|uniref:Uncharacterized protein n=1 Tax=Podarcis lilfordi TaxID=74358 RepID=A0AA35L2V0_9SAUR|nr:Hypothetical predicted protein [Podarcis lilfordi]